MNKDGTNNRKTGGFNPGHAPAAPRGLGDLVRHCAAATAAFVAFSIGAALRHAATGEAPGSLQPIAVTLWGWPFGLPTSATLLWVLRR
ncbi:hypothetical protein [Rhodovulum marinum]|uniref:Uncharacterized protein n=1 Tax=Rhodovulum marinum TaxID=320662 RepID=A0A4R2Q5P7_9RHOB|nr:hypothetical protein [Rhodovulum marinum]TCP43957.1 hypothetical protein EV662_10141 [Rhodovulum marinum]